MIRSVLKGVEVKPRPAYGVIDVGIVSRTATVVVELTVKQAEELENLLREAREEIANGI